MQLGAATLLFCLSQYTILFCTLLAELGYEFGDQWEEVFVLDYHGIECLVVLNQLERAILLFNKKHWSCHRRFERVNSSSTQIFLQEEVQLLLFH